MDYGTDLRLDAGRDISFTPDGDVLLQNGAALVAQDIMEELAIVFGSVEWDRSAGSHLIEQLNSAEETEAFVLNELERVALNDPRVDASAVSAERLSGDRYRLVFSVIDHASKEELLFDMADLLGGGNE